MRKGNILPIAIMVSAVAAFLVVGYFALPWKVFHQCPLIGIQCQPGTVQYDSRQCFKSCTPVSRSNTNSTTTTSTASNTNTSTNTNTVSTADWKTYTSKQYGLTFNYPIDWEVEEGTLNGPYGVFAHPKTAPETPALRFWLDKAYDGRHRAAQKRHRQMLLMPIGQQY